MAGGYSWLAHDCLNYLVSCKTCNQDYKKDYFPISGLRGTARDGVSLLNPAFQKARPFLVNPVGVGDVKPEELIGFHGVLAILLAEHVDTSVGRGMIVIVLFGLNSRVTT